MDFSVKVDLGIPLDNKVKVNLGCGADIRPGWINVDMVRLDGVDMVADLSQPHCLPMLGDNSVDLFHMFHILEHIKEPLPLLEELWRAAKPGAMLEIRVPHGACDMAFADPQHVRQYFPSSFQFFSQLAYTRANYGYLGDWETIGLRFMMDPSLPPNLSHEELTSMCMQGRNMCWELRAGLQAIKPIRIPGSIPINNNIRCAFAPAEV